MENEDKQAEDKTSNDTLTGIVLFLLFLVFMTGWMMYYTG